jgi:hypothetical protein
LNTITQPLQFLLQNESRLASSSAIRIRACCCCSLNLSVPRLA